MKEIIYKNIYFNEIQNLPNYYISRCGKVLSMKRNKKLLKIHNINEYKVVTLYNHRKKNFYLHRLLAIVFISNPKNKPHINHKNGLRDDNRIENLEWVTAKENKRHQIEVLDKIIKEC